jgi:hypothetical protein
MRDELAPYSLLPVTPQLLRYPVETARPGFRRREKKARQLIMYGLGTNCAMRAEPHGRFFEVGLHLLRIPALNNLLDGLVFFRYEVFMVWGTLAWPQ